MLTIRQLAHGPTLALIAALSSSCAQTAVRTETKIVKVPAYIALPAELMTPAPMPAFPTVLTNGSLAQYTLSLQTALKIDIQKLESIQKLQSKL